MGSALLAIPWKPLATSNSWLLSPGNALRLHPMTQADRDPTKMRTSQNWGAASREPETPATAGLYRPVYSTIRDSRDTYGSQFMEVWLKDEKYLRQPYPKQSTTPCVICKFPDHDKLEYHILVTVDGPGM